MLSALVDKPLIQNPLAGGQQAGGAGFRQPGDMGRYVAFNDPGQPGAGFSNLELPVETQFSNVFAVEINDYNNDGYNDIILGGNLYNVKPEVGRYDANYGQILLGNNKLDYKVAPHKKSGLLFKGQVRDFSTFKNLKGDNYLIVLNNSDSLQSYTF